MYDFRRIALCLGTVFIAAMLAGCKASKYGMEAYQKGDYETARHFLYEAHLQERDLPQSYLAAYVDSVDKIVDQELKKGQHETTLALLDEARRITRDDPVLRRARIRVHLSYARSSLRKDDLEQARSSILEVLRLDPSNESALQLRGNINIKLARLEVNNGQWSAAFTRYRDYSRDFPDDQDVRREAADAYIRRGDELVAGHHYKEAISAYADALVYVPGYERAIESGLRAARAAGGGLDDNYRYLINQAPRDRALRAAVVVQLQGRARDAIDAEDIFQGRDYLVAAYRLDNRRDVSLDEYRTIVERIVSYQFMRGDSAQAARTLKEMGQVMEPLAAGFTKRAEEMEESDRAFFLKIKDDIALLNKVHSDVQVTLKHDVGMLTSSQAQQASRMVVFLKNQRDNLVKVSRQRDRRVLDRELFDIRTEDFDVLFNIVEKGRYDEYKILVGNYRGNSR